MTDRRPIIARSLSSSSSVTMGDEENSGGYPWWNDKNILRNRVVGSTIANKEEWMGFTRMKRTHVLLCLLAVLSFFHLQSKGPSIVYPNEVAKTVKKNETAIIKSNNITTAIMVPQSEPLTIMSSADVKAATFEALPTTKETRDPQPTSIIPGFDKPNTATDETLDYHESDIGSSSGNISTDDKSHVESKNRTKNRPLSSTTIIEENNQQNGKIQNMDKGENIKDIDENTDSYAYEKNEMDIKSYVELKNDTQSDGIASTKPPSSSPPLPASDDFNEKTTIKTSTSNTTDVTSQLPKSKTDADLSPMARKFAETHCDLNNLKDGAWYPSGPEDDWQQRAPYLIVAGVWSAGVTSLADALLKHPQVVAAKQNGFFLPKQFVRYYDIQTIDNTLNTNNETVTSSMGNNFNVKVFAARERMYAQVYRKAMLREKTGGNDEDSPPMTVVTSDNYEKRFSKNQHVAMDLSPGLIFYAHKTAHSILCTAPWVKVVVLLRNPIDRLFRQWYYSVTHLNLKLSLEDWMAQEMKLLQSVGIIDGGEKGDVESPNAETDIVVSEKEAWQKYQSVHNVAGAIGRSLYVLQLEEWIQAYVSAGKKPSEEIIILTSEHIEDDPKHEYTKLIRFLGLAQVDGVPNNNGDDDTDSVAATLRKSLMQEPDGTPMTEDTRNMLRQFFKPYNKRLSELLTSNGFEGDWDKLWE